jgi:hypothetical protein
VLGKQVERDEEQRHQRNRAYGQREVEREADQGSRDGHDRKEGCEEGRGGRHRTVRCQDPSVTVSLFLV